MTIEEKLRQLALDALTRIEFVVPIGSQAQEISEQALRTIRSLPTPSDPIR